jgi:hypothetical protein
MVGLHVRLEHGDDTDALGGRDPHVFIHEVGVRIDDGEACPRRAAEQVRGTR